MASMQRRRGEPITLYGATAEVDRRGNTVLRPDPNVRRALRCSESFDRSNRAEVPGQQTVEMINVILPRDIDVGMWAVARYRGSWWDVTAPPAHRVGDRHTGHTTALLRRRPGDMGTGLSDAQG